ncbi:hypothetical protein [Deinococcus sp. QL22]|uniref:hypothetical protein n=1 Tax=Deinococcus sp. QL22 TaxID=2939437 RepID=UPI002016B64F|nr:hypothetical protein [Deinococcus sp. QL22]UQN05994.1 hypothetical protein M1R55_14170 [Deinococcus sp. QL22]
MATLYLILLTFHNITRWLVVIAGVWTLIRTVPALSGSKSFTAADRRPVVLFAGSVHLQVVLGLLLFGLLGSQGAGAFADRSSSYQWQHVGLSLIAAVTATLASALSKRAATDRAKFRVAALWTAVTLLILLVSIPWWRPVLRLFNL